MANKTLADAMIRRLPLPEKGSRITYDSEVAGFGIRLTANGARAFILNYRTKGGRERRYTIGSHSDGVWTATDARKEARRLRKLIDAGGDPMADAEADRAAPTMADLSDRFIDEHLSRKRASTQNDYQGALAKHILPFFGRHVKVADVTFADIDRLHRKISATAPYRANRVTSVLSKMFGLAMRWQMRPDNPCKGVERNREHHRRRYLMGPELARLIAALADRQGDDRQAADIIRILLLTGCRRGEALSMRWADVDLGEGKWTKPAETVKQGVEHSVPLSAPARQLLSDIRTQQTSGRKPLGTWVFPGASGDGPRLSVNRQWHRLCRDAKIEGLRIHDLRHSFASELVSSGASLPLIGALLGHSTVTTTNRYAHLFLDPLRQATEKVGRTIVAAGNSGKPAAPVVPLKPRRHGR